MQRYDGKVIVVQVAGLFAGEQKQAAFFGPGQNGIYWSHYVPELQLNMKKASNMHELDERTWGMLTAGLNVSPIAKGEALKVYKMYMDSDSIQFVLTTTSLEHLRDLDVSKASKEVTTSVNRNQINQSVSVAGFGLVFTFHFTKDALKKEHDYDRTIEEINKYLLPQEEYRALETATEQAVQAAKEAAKNVNIQPGMTRAEVVKALGEPVRSVTFGKKTTLRYQDVTIELEDDKVTDLKPN
jgi:hypothetical protein